MKDYEVLNTGIKPLITTKGVGVNNICPNPGCPNGNCPSFQIWCPSLDIICDCGADSFCINPGLGCRAGCGGSKWTNCVQPN